MTAPISPEFPYESKFLEVNDYPMHYIEEGNGDPILFLHGNPTSNYLWRNIIPHVKDLGRCIAPDLIGMGKSGKPPIPYRFDDHYEFLEKFIAQMGLKNITLVIHDWGSGLGFHYANLHRDNIKGIAFMEAMYKPLEWSDFPKEHRTGFRIFRTPFLGWLLISLGNVFLTKLLPQTILRKLEPTEIENYMAPFPTVDSRKPIRVWPEEIPIAGKPARMHQYLSDYHQWLKETPLPKLLIHANPGALIRKEAVEYIKTNFPNTQVVDVGKGIHFIQEDNPHAIGEAIAGWVRQINS